MCKSSVPSFQYLGMVPDIWESYPYFKHWLSLLAIAVFVCLKYYRMGRKNLSFRACRRTKWTDLSVYSYLAQYSKTISELVANTQTSVVIHSICSHCKTEHRTKQGTTTFRRSGSGLVTALARQWNKTQTPRFFLVWNFFSLLEDLLTIEYNANCL